LGALKWFEIADDSILAFGRGHAQAGHWINTASGSERCWLPGPRGGNALRHRPKGCGINPV